MRRVAAYSRRYSSGASALVTSCEGCDFMPIFMDFHDDLQLSPEMIGTITQVTHDGIVDEHGVRQVDLFHNTDGKVYCLLEAPDADAVRKHHDTVGVSCGEVHEVSGVL